MIAGITFPPLLHPLDIFRAGEVVPVFLFCQPASLSRSLGCLSTLWLGAVLLLMNVAVVGKVQLVAMRTFSFACSFVHGLSFSRAEKVQQTHSAEKNQKKMNKEKKKEEKFLLYFFRRKQKKKTAFSTGRI
jgi:mannitol-specific phosphotransferase system IIBC component